ncbi:hypothetical protein AAZX31_17G162100 [Glycine max]
MNVLHFPSPCAFFFTTCSLFLLKLSFLSQKASIFISKLHECASFSLSMCFFIFFIFFTACSLFLLKLPFLSQKASIFISKLHKCVSFSLSMCFFFHCMFVVFSKVTIFIRKMIYGFFSLLSFYVFFFHLIYLTVTDYCSFFATQKLQFFLCFLFLFCVIMIFRRTKG